MTALDLFPDARQEWSHFHRGIHVGVYLFVVAAVVVLGVLMPQRGPNRIYYIVLMAALHTFVCGFRYMYLTGDLLKYASGYYNMPNVGWFSERVLSEGRNTGFFMLQKLFAQLTDGNFQVFLFFIALVAEVALAILIYRYSPKPWMSYLVWNCLAFYIFGFSAIKQALAMGLLMFAMIDLLEDRPFRFLFWTLLAGSVHAPALAFLPAYWISKARVNGNTVLVYALAAVLMYLFRSQFVDFITSLYYEEEEFILSSNRLGGRFVMILLIGVSGIMLKGFRDSNYAKLFHIIAVAAILQMLSGFDNVFTRLTDYYLQFSVLFIPMTFSNYAINTHTNREGSYALFPFDNQSLALFTILVSAVLFWFYYTHNLNITISYAPDNYLDFRFMWDVVS